MINASFFKDSSGLSGFDINGHSGFGDNGNDIVCAAVSSAVQMAANTITECIGENADVCVSDNLISLRLKDNPSILSRTVLDGLKLHLNLISQDYEGSINISVAEV